MLGQSLTTVQRAALDKQVLWYVSKQLNGEEVARQDLAFVKTGAIRAKEEGLQIAGDVVNSGDSSRCQKNIKC